MNNSYKTILHSSEGLYKEKGSKFHAYIHPIANETEAKELLKHYKKIYYDARHHCYALILEPDSSLQKYNDDGEPAHTAGTPILNKLKSYELTNVICIVVRFFGGTKLGVPGLIEAYKEATEDAIKNSNIETIEIKERINFSTDYELINEVMRICKFNHAQIIDQQYENNKILFTVDYTLKVKASFLHQLSQNFKIHILEV